LGKENSKKQREDIAVTDALNKKGWKVVRIWECEIKKGELKKLKAAGLFAGKG